MTIIDWKEAAPHATLVATLGGHRVWTCPYVLTTDNPRDDPKTCVDFMDTIGRGLRTTLRYGDREDSTVWCKSLAPTRMPGSAVHWQVIATYEPSSLTSKDSDDPLDWRWDISVTSAPVQVAVEKAWNVDPFPLGGAGLGIKRAVDTLGPVHNSAGTVYDPPLMRDITELVLRVTGNLATYSSSVQLAFVNCINDAPIQWSPVMVAKYGFEPATFDQYCVLCSGMSADFMHDASGDYWQHTFEFRLRTRASDGHFQNPQDGFLETVLDRGIARSAKAGDPDGDGGTISALDIEDGMAEAEAIRDSKGGRVPELVLLNGHGQPLQGGDVNVYPPVYFRWRVHPYAYFPALPLPIWTQ
jgi:hypothetical protein